MTILRPLFCAPLPAAPGGNCPALPPPPRNYATVYAHASRKLETANKRIAVLIVTDASYNKKLGKDERPARQLCCNPFTSYVGHLLPTSDIKYVL